MTQKKYLTEVLGEIDPVYQSEMLEFLQSQKRKQNGMKIILFAATMIAVKGIVSYTDLGKHCLEKFNWKQAIWKQPMMKSS